MMCNIKTFEERICPRCGYWVFTAPCAYHFRDKKTFEERWPKINWKRFMIKWWKKETIALAEHQAICSELIIPKYRCEKCETDLSIKESIEIGLCILCRLLISTGNEDLIEDIKRSVE